jgi:hypothetical protein
MQTQQLAGPLQEESMSHHFDTKQAKKNPSFNICDMYVFDGANGKTVMAMTVNADAGISGPDFLPKESLYAFRFDTNRDGREDVVFKFQFDEPHHRNGNEHSHTQSFRVRKASGDQIRGDGGEILVEGVTGNLEESSGVRAFVGVAPELWAADAIAFFNLLNGLYKEDRFDGDVFLHSKNFFRNRNVVAMVLEVPTSTIGDGKVHVWATGSLFGHAPEVQVCRWGLPLFTHLFLSDPSRPDLPESFHANPPSQDQALFSEAVAGFVSKMAARAGSTDDPEAYGQQIASRLLPVMLPYELGTKATFGLSAFNGRPLETDAYDIMLSLSANRPIVDGVSPDRDKIRSEFPYFGERYSKEEQVGLEPISTGFYES